MDISSLFNTFQPFFIIFNPFQPKMTLFDLFVTLFDLKLLYFPVKTREIKICTPPKVRGAYRESPKIPGAPLMAT